LKVCYCKALQRYWISSDHISDNGVERLLLDTAGTSGGVLGQLDVTLVTPGGGPRVLDEPVVLTVLGTGTNSEDSVVKLGTATGGENTRLVGLESSSVSLNGDGERSLVKGRLHLAG